LAPDLRELLVEAINHAVATHAAVEAVAAKGRDA
jgi:hypothetical protein